MPTFGQPALSNPAITSAATSIFLQIALVASGCMMLAGCDGSGSSAASPPMSSIEITPADPRVAMGTSAQLTATASNSGRGRSDVRNYLTWTSSNPSVATVNSRGMVRGVNVGTARIMATCQMADQCSDLAGAATVTVTAATLVSISIAPAVPGIALAATVQFVATGAYSDQSTRPLTTSVTWASSNSSVAAISNTANSQGLASGLQTGSSAITASLGSVTSPAVTMTVTAPVEAVLWSFGSGNDGGNPQGVLIQGGDGNFYGTTVDGGANQSGTVFEITPAGVETVLWSFGSGSDGQNPTAGLTLGADGNFYGTTSGGGVNQSGTVFKITPTGVESVLWSFAGAGAGDGEDPNAGLIEGIDGSFYGTTFRGGTHDAGIVFKIAPNGAETVLWSFGNGNDGQYPAAGLVQGADGAVYGTTELGGANSHGTVFDVTPAGAETVLWSFGSGNDGQNPTAALVQGIDGNFYGTTIFGGAHTGGTVFSITPTGVETLLYSFGAGTDGDNPLAGLIQGADGNFFGTTQYGGTQGFGTLFEITPAGAETVLWSFGSSSDGQNPTAGLTLGADGNFYGTTSGGGAQGAGTVFRF